MTTATLTTVSIFTCQINSRVDQQLGAASANRAGPHLHDDDAALALGDLLVLLEVEVQVMAVAVYSRTWSGEGGG